MTKLLIGLGVLILVGALFSLLLALQDKLFPRKEETREPGGPGAEERLQAVVHCTGGGAAFLKYQYQGVRDCLAASLLPGGGPLGCDYGCLGMGTCQQVCPTGAIRVQEGAAAVDGERCTACGKCVEACPRHLISLESYRPGKHVSVPCASKAREETVSELCADGCVGCGICVGVCPREAITLEEGLARIDYDKCDHCGLCAQKCPRRLIRVETVEALPQPEPPKPPRERKKPKRVKPMVQLPKVKRLKKDDGKEAVPEEPGEERELPLPEEAVDALLTELKTEPEESPAVSEEVPSEPETAAVEPAPEVEPEAASGPEPEPEVVPTPEPAPQEPPTGARTSAEEAFQAFAKAVAAAGEALGDREDGEEKK